MNEQLQAALTTLLDKSLNAVDFMVAELPEVIQQLLLWKMWESAIGCAIGMVIVVCSIFYFKKLFKMASAYDKETSTLGKYRESVRPFCAFFLIPLIFGILVVFHNVIWLQILIAPKVYLIEYAANLAK